MDEYIRKYNSTLRELIDIVHAEFPKNTTIETIQRQFRTAVTIDRTLVIEVTAPELLQYRDLIAEGRWDDLISTDWESKISEKAPSDEVDNNALRQLVPLLRRLYKSLDEEQKKFIQKSLKRLLSYCVKYFKAKSS